MERELFPFSQEYDADAKVMQWQKVATYAKFLIAIKLNRQTVSPSDVTAVEQMTFVNLESLVRSVCLDIILHVLYKRKILNGRR